MKKNIFLFLISYFLFFPVSSFAASPTPSPEKIQTQIDDLKERIASRVAQLKLVEKRGIIGVVTDVSGTQITLTDIKGNTRFVDVDELTKFFPLKKSNETFGISDITKGETLGVLGLYNKQSRRILARVVDEMSLPKFVHGAVSSVDSDNFSFKVLDSDNKEFSIDVETTSRTFYYDSKTNNLVRSGFSKIKVEENIFVIGLVGKYNRISAAKILLFPDLPKNPKIVVVPSPSAQPIIPSTGSGKKLTPIVK